MPSVFPLCVVCWWSWWRLCTLNCVVLCFAPPLFRLPSFLILSMYLLLLKRVAVYSFLSCVTEMFLVPLFGVFVVFSGIVMFCCKRMLCRDRLVLP